MGVSYLCSCCICDQFQIHYYLELQSYDLLTDDNTRSTNYSPQQKEELS